MRQTDTSTLRESTIRYWAGFIHARGSVDVARVHAFQALMREHPDLSAVTDDQVTEAYGGRGWVPAPVCYECGARDDTNVQFGPVHDVALCAGCIAQANTFDVYEPPSTAVPPPAKTNIFTRLFRKGA
jgi:hypothetical protein